MSRRELTRVEVFARVTAGTLSLGTAAGMLGVSYRQTKRLWRRYRDAGAKGLQHRGVGKRSNRGTPSRVQHRVLALIRQKYSGGIGERFGPTLAAEHLASEDGVTVHHETLRRWMLAAGLWSRARKRLPYRQRRARRAHAGELVQLDGSFHAWFETRSPTQPCLISLVDDATSASRRSGARVARNAWHSAGALHRLEKRLRAGRHRGRTGGGPGPAHPIWPDV